MALNGYVTDAEQHWSEDAEEAAPITSRSPSFVRLKEAEDVRAPDSIEDLVTESSPPTARIEKPRAADTRAMRVRCTEHALDLEVRLLQLEESARQIDDARVADAVRCLIDDVGELDDFLRTAKLDASLAIVQHVYEWAVNVVAQADARIAAAKRGEEPLESIGLTVAEYSSLFVRAILLPMIESSAASLDAEEASALARLRNLVAWTNWTIRRICPVDA